jgi:hypothetical protein
MPRDAILLIHRDLLGSLPNGSGRVQQKMDPGENGLARRASTVANPLARRRSAQCCISA